MSIYNWLDHFAQNVILICDEELQPRFIFETLGVSPGNMTSYFQHKEKHVYPL